VAAAQPAAPAAALSGAAAGHRTLPAGVKDAFLEPYN
jgi:hypothetical protein